MSETEGSRAAPAGAAWRDALESELRAAELASDRASAFGHLERAHILSQRRTMQHVRVHARMWRLGFRARDAREVVGQTMRIVAALLFSRIWVPEGNTGGANVSAFAPMPVPPDLAALLGIRASR